MIADKHWITEKVKEYKKEVSVYVFFIIEKAFNYADHSNSGMASEK